MRRFTKILLCVAMVIGLGGLTTVSADASTSRKLTASYSTKTPLTKSSVTVHGTINHSAKGTTVTVQRKSGKKWKTAKSTKTTTSAGAYSVKVTMSSSRGSYSYRVYVAKKSHLKSATSSTTKISVRSLQKVTLSASHSTIGKGSAVTLSGAVSPFKSKAKVTVESYTSSAWHKLSTPTLSSKGKFTYSPKPTTTTKYRVISGTQSSSYLAAGTSSSRTVTVIAQPTSINPLPDAETSAPYSAQLATNAGRAGTWTNTGSLPPGLTLNSSGGITWTPATPGTSTFTAKFTDKALPILTLTQSVSITVVPQADPLIATATLPNGTVGAAYSSLVTTTVSKPGIWSISAGSLPTGLNPIGAATGKLTGTPTASGTFTPTFRFTQTSDGHFVDRPISITINPVPTITTKALPHGALDSPYNAPLGMTGGPGTWTLSAGSLPAGLSLSSTGLISGTPTTKVKTLGTSFTVKFTATSGLSAIRSLTIPIDPFIASTGFPPGTAGAPYAYELQNGTAPGKWEFLGGLPAGLTLDSNGLLHGIPSAAGSVYLFLTFNPDAPGFSSETLQAPITIEPPMPATPAATTISAGSIDACRVKADGTLWCWGYNLGGQLGIGQVDQQNANFSSPQQVGHRTDWRSVSVGSFYTACAIRTDDSMWCMGENNDGQLGTGSIASADVPTAVKSTNQWTSVSVGGLSTCGITTTGDLWCWGDYVLGSSLVPVKISSGWKSLSIGVGGPTCGIKTDDTLWCWGSNFAGQVGDGTTVDAPAPTQIGTSTWTSVTTGPGHTCAIGTDKTLWCWGENANGQVGTGSSADKLLSPQQVGSGSDWATVTAGGANLVGFTCATTTSGTAWCWGSNAEGQLGNGTTEDAPEPVRIDSTTSWSSVSAGINAVCGVKRDESQRCWGQGGYGQLGNGSEWDMSTVPVTVQ